MYVCMYTFAYICMHATASLKDLLFSCVGEPDAANRQQGLSFKQRNWRECKRLDMHDFDAISITPKEGKKTSRCKSGERTETDARSFLFFALV